MLKKLFSILILISVLFIMMGNISASTYTISNSTNVEDISKMISGEIAIKNNNFIKNGDTVKFKAGNYNNISLVIKNRITLINSKASKNKVNFIGDGTGVAITLKTNKIKLYGLNIRNYDTGVFAKTTKSTITNMVFSKNTMVEIRGNSNNIAKNKISKTSTFLVSGKHNKISYNRFSSTGLLIKKSKNTVKNNNLKNNNYLIEILGNRNIISLNKVSNSKNTGITITKGRNNKVENNSVSKSHVGISGSISKNIFLKNKISKCSIGILYLNKKDKIEENKFSKNKSDSKLYEYIPNAYD